MIRIASLACPYPEASAPAPDALTLEGGNAPMSLRIVGTFTIPQESGTPPIPA